VREEAQDGLDRDILVPARIEAILLPIGFRTIQTADLSHWAGDQAHPGFAQLVEDIAAALGEAPPGERVPNLEAKPEKPAQRAAEPKKVIDLRDLPDLAVFRDVDAPWYPELVALPAGDFLMGSPEDEEGCSDDESPQHRVTIGYRFALGRYPVTYDEYDHFCTAAKRKKPGDEGWGRGRRPVINVSWLDAQAYVEWLAKETSKPYRLPSEAEWEYACRAGTTTPFSYGETIITDQANYDSHYTYGKGAEGVYRWRRTTEVGSFAANPWGLYDMHGNVWEWVEDVWHGNYEGAPADGSPWTNVLGKESSSHRVLRGGSWEDDPRGGR
jgi:formylglycine-generating enzyme required for sulfatase activity